MPATDLQGETMGLSELTPCPFCGNTNFQLSSNGWENHFVSCMECGAEGPSAMTEPEAMDSWNSRAEAKAKERQCVCLINGTEGAPICSGPFKPSAVHRNFCMNIVDPGGVTPECGHDRACHLGTQG